MYWHLTVFGNLAVAYIGRWTCDIGHTNRAHGQHRW